MRYTYLGAGPNKRNYSNNARSQTKERHGERSEMDAERSQGTVTTLPLADSTVVTAPMENDEDSPVKQSIRPGARTSDFYNVKNIPERFNHPDWFEGYQTEPQHPLFSTSSSSYGSKSPSVHTMPTQFHGRSQKFTQNLGKFGMYRNHSLNTDMDHSRV